MCVTLRPTSESSALVLKNLIRYIISKANDGKVHLLLFVLIKLLVTCSSYRYRFSIISLVLLNAY